MPQSQKPAPATISRENMDHAVMRGRARIAAEGPKAFIPTLSQGGFRAKHCPCCNLPPDDLHRLDSALIGGAAETTVYRNFPGLTLQQVSYHVRVCHTKKAVAALAEASGADFAEAAARMTTTFTLEHAIELILRGLDRARADAATLREKGSVAAIASAGNLEVRIAQGMSNLVGEAMAQKARMDAISRLDLIEANQKRRESELREGRAVDNTKDPALRPRTVAALLAAKAKRASETGEDLPPPTADEFAAALDAIRAEAITPIDPLS